MRWGVRDEAQVDQTTTALLLREIHKCQKLSVGPNFVVGYFTEEGRKEENVLFNDALNTFCLWLYGVGQGRS